MDKIVGVGRGVCQVVTVAVVVISWRDHGNKVSERLLCVDCYEKRLCQVIPFKIRFELWGEIICHFSDFKIKTHSKCPGNMKTFPK